MKTLLKKIGMLSLAVACSVSCDNGAQKQKKRPQADSSYDGLGDPGDPAANDGLVTSGGTDTTTTTDTNTDTTSGSTSTTTTSTSTSTTSTGGTTSTGSTATSGTTAGKKLTRRQRLKQRRALRRSHFANNPRNQRRAKLRQAIQTCVQNKQATNGAPPRQGAYRQQCRRQALGKANVAGSGAAGNSPAVHKFLRRQARRAAQAGGQPGTANVANAANVGLPGGPKARRAARRAARIAAAQGGAPAANVQGPGPGKGPGQGPNFFQRRFPNGRRR